MTEAQQPLRPTASLVFSNSEKVLALFLLVPPLPETSREASHVLGHPALVRRRQRGLLHRLQVS